MCYNFICQKDFYCIKKLKLSLDLGSRTGWATDDCGILKSGFEVFLGKRHEGAGMPLLKFRRWLDRFRPLLSEVVFESVNGHKGTFAAQYYGGLVGVLMEWCEEYNIPYRGIPVGTIKKFITGKGNASKDEVIESLKKRGFSNLVDHNEADAIAILLCSEKN